MTHIAVIDYGASNLRSVVRAVVHTAPKDARVSLVREAGALNDATHIILPGVGAFGDCWRGLSALDGMIEALNQSREAGKPMLGICVGMQLMAERGFEYGEHPGLGWLPAEVRPIMPKGGLKIPHMGWNRLQLNDTALAHPVCHGLSDGDYAYFVHSYHMVPTEDMTPDWRFATVEYGAPLTAMVGADTFIGTQFHPEKSQAVGLRLLENFAKWKP